MLHRDPHPPSPPSPHVQTGAPLSALEIQRLRTQTRPAGHVTVQDHAIISGLNGIHQFVIIGEYSFIGGGSRVTQDVPPFTKAVGSPIELYGLNTIGLQRAGVGAEVVTSLKRAYRIVFNSDLSLGRAIARAREEVPLLPEVERFLSFVESSGRGVPA